MTDDALAADLLDEIIGTRGVREPVKAMLERAYSALAKVNKEWTRRRVRAVFNGEARRIEHREIAEMQTIIEARKAHAEHRKETSRLVAVALSREAHSAGRTSAELGG